MNVYTRKYGVIDSELTEGNAPFIRDNTGVSLQQFFPHTPMYSQLLLLKLGMLSGLLTLAGVILLIIWATKNLSKNQLKHASLWLIGLGIALGIVAGSGVFGIAGMGWGRGMMGGDSYNRAMMDALRSRGMEMDEGDFNEMMEEARGMMQGRKMMW